MLEVCCELYVVTWDTSMLNPLAVEGSHKTEEVLSWKGKRVFKLTSRHYQKVPPVSRRGTAFPHQGHGRVRIERPQSSGGPVNMP